MILKKKYVQSGTGVLPLYPTLRSGGTFIAGDRLKKNKNLSANTNITVDFDVGGCVYIHYVPGLSKGRPLRDLISP